MPKIKTLNTRDAYYVSVVLRVDGSIKFHDVGTAKLSISAATGHRGPYELWELQSGAAWRRVLGRDRSQFRDDPARWKIPHDAPPWVREYIEGRRAKEAARKYGSPEDWAWVSVDRLGDPDE